MTNPLEQDLSELTEPDQLAKRQIANRLDEILRPVGALNRLDKLAIFVAGWQASSEPIIKRPHILIFAGDHGVASAGVSAYPTDVTASMMLAFQSGVSTINALAEVAGATVTAVDVGVGRPTKDIRYEAAMSPERFEEAWEIGGKTVREMDCDLLVLGEMGIGNTTPSAAICASLVGGDVESWVGRGTGVDDVGLARKCSAVQKAVSRVGSVTPYETLRQLGGTEMVAIAAAIVEARKFRVPIVLDGFVVSAAATPLYKSNPGAIDHCLAGHQSAELGHRRLLEFLNMNPILDLEFRLGEGSGAAAAIPLISMACAAATKVPTFSEFFEAET